MNRRHYHRYTANGAACCSVYLQRNILYFHIKLVIDFLFDLFMRIRLEISNVLVIYK